MRKVLADGRAVIARGFRRGGCVEKLGITGLFLRPVGSAAPRPIAELRLLERLRAAGANVPSPVCAEVRWRWAGAAYSGVIVTEEIPESCNLLLAARAGAISNAELARIAGQAGAEAARLLGANVFHPDLHPGNVLFQPRLRSVYLIDFDRAYDFPERR
jgi:tRNA A-37 threonylcarbamoyl transferase component Bud32